VATRNQPTHYELLGVKRDATTDEIKQAYRRLVRTAHPDVGGSAAMFELLVHAYEELSDPASRREYDDRLDDQAGARPADLATLQHLLREQETALRLQWEAEAAAAKRQAATTYNYPAPVTSAPDTVADDLDVRRRRWILFARARACVLAGSATGGFYLLHSTGALGFLGATAVSLKIRHVFAGFRWPILLVFVALGVVAEYHTAFGVRILCTLQPVYRRCMLAMIMASICLFEYLARPAGLIALVLVVVGANLPLMVPRPWKSAVARWLLRIWSPRQRPRPR
jgi:hypothetical protein